MSEEKFNFSYQAPTKDERQEIESIRQSYKGEPVQKSKLEELRDLDRRVKRAPAAVSVISGVVGILVFGLGMTCILEWDSWIWGIICSLLGCIPMAFAYPVYRWILKRNKKKYGRRILELSEELLNEEKN